MSATRTLRDVAAALAGAAIAMAAVAWIERLGPDLHRPPGVPADDPGDLMAWAVHDPAGGVELLGNRAAQGLATCRLPTDGSLRPMIDPGTGLPRRIEHWLAGGPRLYVMELRQAFEGGQPPPTWTVAADPARCPSGRVLVTGETIMNFLYVRTAKEVSDRR